MHALLRLWRAHPILLSSFALALTLTVFFGVRSLTSLIYWSDPRHQDQALERWMTVGYVEHSYSLPRGTLFESLGVDRDGKRPTLERIAQARGVSVQDLITQIEALIQTARDAQ